MKVLSTRFSTLVLLAILILGFSNCDKTEDEIIADITPEMTATVGGEAWTTKIAAGVNTTIFVITGNKAKEQIILTIPTKTIGDYDIDGLNNMASYVQNIDSIGDAYIAYSGEINVQSMNTLRTQVNGTFNFKAVNTSLDTISITSGTFKNIPTK